MIVIRPQLKSIPKLFPVLLKIINEKFYTDTNDFEIPIGSELISINNIKATELRNRLLKYAPSDGYNTSKKYRQIEREFGILHFYEFGPKSSYQITYRTPSNKILSKKIESQSFESIGKRFSQRNSYFSIYHKSKNKSQFIKNTLGKKEPFLYFVDSLNTAVLTINTFGLDKQKFQTNIKGLFRDLKQKKTKNLIIDIRQNEGGYPENAMNTFSYIANETFIQPLSQHVITSSLPQNNYSQEINNEYTYKSFFENYFQNSSKQGNEWTIYAPKNELSIAPSKKGYKGKTFILIGGKTFSASATFALNCKNQGIPLIGEETGGGYYLHTGGFPVIYELPNSKIKIMLSFVKIKKYVKDKTVKKGTGVLPDIKIKLTIQDLIKGRDSQLDYVLKYIKKELD
ncbi:S41 family peptidase [Aquimarina pacifica]|uniref:S41 family peptidase n=1 Tax=Aquimarina pacifica TaxID=1296415 RepID=UPI000472CD79|nr:S41 family peptidase [Aquimarina pacifica]